jgi:type I restriction enzyme R subunit
MRDVRSALYFEQMRGRGVRSLDPTDLSRVTPDAPAKERFVLIDAVGVTESEKTLVQPLERKRGVAFEKLLENVASGQSDPDTVSSLAHRLAMLDRKLGPEDKHKVEETAGKSRLLFLRIAVGIRSAPGRASRWSSTTRKCCLRSRAATTL